MFSLDELVPGYRNWFLSFPRADLWIAAMSILAIVMAASNRPMSAIAMAAAASGMVFLGLDAFTYGINTGLVTNGTVEEIVEIAIKVYCLSAGGWMVVSACRQAVGFARS